MPGDGPFMWFSDLGPPRSFQRLPKDGLCLSAFLFVRRGRELLLGQYADDPRWEDLAGLDPERWRVHGKGWTVPASHMRWGEDPRESARRVAEDILGLKGLRLSEPRVETDVYAPVRFPDRKEHVDFWFFFDAEVPSGTEVARPPWFRALAWHDPHALPAGAYGRSHEDVVQRWLQKR